MTAGAPPADPRLAPLLSRAARYRFLSLLLAPPRPGRQAALRALALETPPAPAVDLGGALEPDDDQVLAEHFRLLGPAGRVSGCASDHIRGGYADKGPILGDIAGFYLAFGFTPELKEAPDHFANLTAFLALLCLKQAHALHQGDPEQAGIARDAERKLARLHLHPYLGRFADRLAAHAPAGGLYATVAAYTRAAATAAERELEVEDAPRPTTPPGGGASLCPGGPPP